MIKKMICILGISLFTVTISIASTDDSILPKLTKEVEAELASNKNFNNPGSGVTKIDSSGTIEIRKFAPPNTNDMFLAYSACTNLFSMVKPSEYMEVGGKFIIYWYAVNGDNGSGVLKKQVLTYDICSNIRNDGIVTNTALGYRQSFKEYLNTNNYLEQYFNN
ncbi:hypothetical protein [Francisella tularensis]|uniref:hypothetical protein n=1 Tax=Francisella tularensis TaxID=263 RepID=UPI0008F49E31|nr:hypothetical protein [Francisella tularensis]APA83242.1 hypothetical protein N894_1258 [Francisella tularensis subsp. novicida PA10-7858]